MQKLKLKLNFDGTLAVLEQPPLNPGQAITLQVETSAFSTSTIARLEANINLVSGVMLVNRSLFASSTEANIWECDLSDIMESANGSQFQLSLKGFKTNVNNQSTLIGSAFVNFYVNQGSTNYSLQLVDKDQTTSILEKINQNSQIITQKQFEDYTLYQMANEIGNDDLITINKAKTISNEPAKVRGITIGQLIAKANTAFSDIVDTIDQLPANAPIGTKIKVLYEQDGITPHNYIYEFNGTDWVQQGKADITVDDFNALEARVDTNTNDINDLKDKTEDFTNLTNAYQFDKNIIMPFGRLIGTQENKITGGVFKYLNTEELVSPIIATTNVTLNGENLRVKLQGMIDNTTSNTSEINTLKGKVDVNSVSGAIATAKSETIAQIPTEARKVVDSYRAGSLAGLGTTNIPLERKDVATSYSQDTSGNPYLVLSANATKTEIAKKLATLIAKQTGGTNNSLSVDKNTLEFDNTAFTVTSTASGVKIGFTGDVGSGGSGGIGGDIMDYATAVPSQDVNITATTNNAETILPFALESGNRPANPLIVMSDGKFEIQGKAWFSLQDLRLVIQATANANADRNITVRCYKRAGVNGVRNLLAQRTIVMPRTIFTTTPFVWNMETFADQSETADTDIYDFTVFFTGQAGDTITIKVAGQNGQTSYGNAFATVSRPIILTEYVKKTEFTGDTIVVDGNGNTIRNESATPQLPASQSMYATGATNVFKFPSGTNTTQKAIDFIVQKITDVTSLVALDGSQGHQTMGDFSNTNYGTHQQLDVRVQDLNASKISKAQHQIKYGYDAFIDENFSKQQWESENGDASIVAMQNGNTVLFPIKTSTTAKGAALSETVDRVYTISGSQEITIEFGNDAFFADTNNVFESVSNGTNLTGIKIKSGSLNFFDSAQAMVSAFRMYDITAGEDPFKPTIADNGALTLTMYDGTTAIGSGLISHGEETRVGTPQGGHLFTASSVLTMKVKLSAGHTGKTIKLTVRKKAIDIMDNNNKDWEVPKSTSARVAEYSYNAIQLSNSIGEDGYTAFIDGDGRIKVFNRETAETHLVVDKREVKGVGALSTAMAFNQTVYNKVDIETFQNSIIDQYGAQVTYTTSRPVKLLFKTSNLAVLKTYTLTISNANDSKEFVLSDPGVLTTENIGGVNYQVVNFNDNTFAFTTGQQLFSFSKQGDDASGLGTVNYNDARYTKSTDIREIKTSTTAPTVNDASILTIVSDGGTGDNGGSGGLEEFVYTLTIENVEGTYTMDWSDLPIGTYLLDYYSSANITLAPPGLVDLNRQLTSAGIWQGTTIGSGGTITSNKIVTDKLGFGGGWMIRVYDNAGTKYIDAFPFISNAPSAGGSDYWLNRPTFVCPQSSCVASVQILDLNKIGQVEPRAVWNVITYKFKKLF